MHTASATAIAACTTIAESTTIAACATFAESTTITGSTVEERPFKGRATRRIKENNSTLPKAVAAERSSKATGAKTDLSLFPACVKAGECLAETHFHYEQQPEYPLKKIEEKGETVPKPPGLAECVY